jgi:hypothetical protein
LIGGGRRRRGERNLILEGDLARWKLVLQMMDLSLFNMIQEEKEEKVKIIKEKKVKGIDEFWKRFGELQYCIYFT